MVDKINQKYNLNLTEDKIPLDDKKTWDLISSGKTLGVFQFASPLGISTVRKMHPANIEELAAATSFIRPGSSGLDNYMKGKDDATKVAKTDERLDKCLKSTYGAIVFQEQIMMLISELLGVSFGQADIYRRALEKPNKGKNVKIVKEFNEAVVEKATQLGFSPKVAENVKNSIIENSGYSFNKCLAGSEIIYDYDVNNYKLLENKKITIKEMYLIKNDMDYAKEHYQITLRKLYNTYGYGFALSMNEDGKLIKNKIIDITFSGKLPVYNVETETGEKVKCTMNHKFPTPNGNKLLSELTIGDKLYVNDNYTTKLSKIKSITYLHEEDTYNIEMADPYHNLLMNDGIVVCNSHAVCYSVISYQTAWMKMNYPIVFYSIMLDDCSESDFTLFLQEAKARGIEIGSPDINKSKYLCQIEGDDTIRIGLKSIKGVGPAAVKCIEELQPFDSLNDFMNKKTAAVNKKVLEALVNIGALNSLGVEIDEEDKVLYKNTKIEENKIYFDREQLKIFFKHYILETEKKSIPNYLIPKSNFKGKILNQFEMVEEDGGFVIPEDKLSLVEVDLTEEEKAKYKTRKKPKGEFKDLTKSVKISPFKKVLMTYANELDNIKEDKIANYINEFEALGYSFIEHPCQKYINKIYDKNNPKSTFKDIKDGSLCLTCGFINGIEEKLTKNKKTYYVVNLVTPVDIVQLQLWGNQYENLKDKIQLKKLIIVRGIKGYGRISVEAIEPVKVGSKK